MFWASTLNGQAAYASISIGSVLASDISQCWTFEPIGVDATLNSLTAGRINFAEGFAFDLIDF